MLNFPRLPFYLRSKILRHSLGVTFLLFLLLSIGTIGYRILEHWEWIDCLYMTIITITTVGYREISPLSHTGKLFTMGLILYSVVMVAYIIGYFTKLLVESEIFFYFGRKKLERHIQSLRDHYIICGFGRIGSFICEELKKAKQPFVVIENDEAAIREMEKNQYLFVIGNATQDETLIQAGIRRAKGLVTAVHSDADNLFITLTGRELNPNVFILSRSSGEVAESKLKLAGANKVVSPYKMGALRMANTLLHPAIVDFAETVFQSRGLDLQIEEIAVEKTSKLVDQTLKESNLRGDFGVIIAAIKQPSGKMVFNPSANEKIEVGDKLVALGKRDGLDKLEKTAH